MKKIIFETYDVGMPRNAIKLSKHNPLWKKCFDQFCCNLVPYLEGCPIDFHHIGSTAIQSIRAKPILDIMGIVSTLALVDSFRQPIEQFGFEWKGEFGINGRRFCVFYNEQKTYSYVHFHVFCKGNSEIEKHLLFRDALNSNDKLAADYENLKIKLATQYSDQRENYTRMKADFIHTVLKSGRK